MLETISVGLKVEQPFALHNRTTLKRCPPASPRTFHPDNLSKFTATPTKIFNGSVFCDMPRSFTTPPQTLPVCFWGMKYGCRCCGPLQGTACNMQAQPWETTSKQRGRDGSSSASKPSVDAFVRQESTAKYFGGRGGILPKYVHGNRSLLGSIPLC